MREENEALCQLAQAYLDGVPQAYDEICRLKARSVIYICSIELGSMEAGQAAAAAVFARLQEELPHLEDARQALPWLYKLVLKVCAEHRRQGGNKPAIRLWRKEETAKGEESGQEKASGHTANW